jgi:CO/xanthine dehydrogenase Mo-binding subunit
MAIDAPLATPDDVAGAKATRIHRDFAEKVSGSLKYADDWTLPGMLEGVVVRSQFSCGRIVRIDTAAALAVEGVRAVLTAADVPRKVKRKSDIPALPTASADPPSAGHGR